MVWIIALGMFAIPAGLSIGLTGIGGFLLPPMLVAALGLDGRTAVALTLLSLVPVCIATAYLHGRRHAFEWRLAAVLTIGTLPGLAVGRAFSASLSDEWAARILAVGLLGVALLLVRARGEVSASATSSRRRADRGGPRITRLTATALAGFVAGIAGIATGVGGPVVVVPILVAVGVGVDAAVGAAVMNAVVVAGLGAVLLAPSVQIDPAIVATIAAGQLVGLAAAFVFDIRVDAARIRLLVAVLSIVAAGYLIERTM